MNEVILVGSEPLRAQQWRLRAALARAAGLNFA